MNDIPQDNITAEEALAAEELTLVSGLTPVALLDALDEEGLNTLIEVAAKTVRRYYALLTAAGEGKLPDDLAGNFLYEFHRRMFSANDTAEA